MSTAVRRDRLVVHLTGRRKPVTYAVTEEERDRVLGELRSIAPGDLGPFVGFDERFGRRVVLRIADAQVVRHRWDIALPASFDALRSRLDGTGTVRLYLRGWSKPLDVELGEDTDIIDALESGAYADGHLELLDTDGEAVFVRVADIMLAEAPPLSGEEGAEE